MFTVDSIPLRAIGSYHWLHARRERYTVVSFLTADLFAQRQRSRRSMLAGSAHKVNSDSYLLAHATQMTRQNALLCSHT
eukprot:979338-Pleurochrysis_carterae.AAC.1